MAKLKFHSIPVGADERTYRPGIKKERVRKAEAYQRILVARRALLSPEDRAIEDDLAKAMQEAHWQRRRDQDVMTIDQAQANYDRAASKARAEAEVKRKDLAARVSVEGDVA